VLAAMTLTATPVQAQVNWDALLSGKWGAETCPPGHTESNPTLFASRSANAATANTVTFRNPNLTLSNLRAFTFDFTGTSFNVVLVLRKNGTSFSGYQTLDTVTADTPVTASTFTLSNLDSNTRYTAILHVSDDTNPFAKACFRTAYTASDMNTTFSGSGSIGGMSGCFALGGECLGGGDAAVRACFCGARNRLGQWARTGTVEPGTNLTNDSTYKWLMPSMERTRRGCTTN